MVIIRCQSDVFVGDDAGSSMQTTENKIIILKFVVNTKNQTKWKTPTRENSDICDEIERCEDLIQWS